MTPVGEDLDVLFLDAEMGGELLCGVFDFVEVGFGEVPVAGEGER